MIDAYRTVAEPATAKVMRKRSRFLSFVVPAATPTEIGESISALRRAHHDATHYCSAYRLLTEDGIIEHSDDDGEPHGSAGVPMLQRLAAEDLVNTLAVVIRFYGGTKLGVGGLVRAYSDAVAEAIAAAPKVTRRIEIEIRVSFPAELTSAVMSVLHRHGVPVRGIGYDRDAHITAALPPSRVEGFITVIREATGAKATVEVGT